MTVSSCKLVSCALYALENNENEILMTLMAGLEKRKLSVDVNVGEGCR
jgi:hypothetical protein